MRKGYRKLIIKLHKKKICESCAQKKEIPSWELGDCHTSLTGECGNPHAIIEESRMKISELLIGLFIYGVPKVTSFRTYDEK